jgi:hypothetical protein
LIQKAWDLADAREYVREANIFGGIFLSEREKESVSDEFDVDGGIVFVVLNCVEFEEIEGDLVVEETEVGSVLRVERVDGSFLLKTGAPVTIKLLLEGHGLWTDVVELGVECNQLAGFGIGMLVIARAGGGNRGKGKRIFDELIGEAGELRVRYG